MDQDGKLAFPDLRKALNDMRNPKFQLDRRRLSDMAEFYQYTEDEGEQGLTLVHLSAQLERFLCDRGCA